jgi:hypothetical protein
MSADNWRICPKCKIKHEENIAANQRRVSESYGKIPSDKYMDAVREIQNPKPLEQTLREDYEQGIDEDGEYSCLYRAGCTVCNFSFTFSTKIEPETVFKQNK